MSRIEQALIDGGNSYNPEATAAIVNLANTGNNGISRDLAYLGNNTPYQQQQTIFLLLRPPRMFEKHPLGDQLTAALKVFIEEWPNTVEGIELQLSIDQNSTEQGWDRQTLRTPNGVYRAEQTLSFTGIELYNKAWTKFWTYFVRTFIGDPQSASPNLAELNETPDDYLFDQYTFDVLAIEPDPLKKNVVSCCACVGLWPATLPSDALRKNITEGTPSREITLEFPCIIDDSKGFHDMGQSILDQMQLYSLNTERRSAFITEIDADVASAQSGILDEAERLSSSWS